MKRLFLILLAGLSTFCAGALEWRHQDGRLNFDNGAGRFEFGGHAYGGVQFDGFNFFVWLPVWKDGRQYPALQLGAPAAPAYAVYENPDSQLVAAVYRLTSATTDDSGAVPAAGLRLHMRFRQWRGLPLLEVRYRLENRSGVNLEFMPMLVGNGIPNTAEVTSERWSPPPAAIVTEPLEVKFQMSTHPCFLLRGEGRGFGLIGQQCRNYNGKTLELYREKEPLPAGAISPEYAIVFVAAVESFPRLEQYDRALGILRQRLFAGMAQGGFVTADGFAVDDTRITPEVTPDAVSIAMKAFDSVPEQRLARFRVNGDPVWQDDCLELSVAAAKNPEHYRHGIVNVLGARTLTGNPPETPGDDGNSWSVTAGTDADGWQAKYTLAVTPEDAAILAREGALRLHCNREAHFRGENSGWPDASFHQPASFGLLLPVDYPEYLRRQETICQALSEQPVKVEFHPGNLLEMALADAELTALRRRLEFRKDIADGFALLQSDPGAPALPEILARTRQAAQELGEMESFNRLQAAYRLHASGGKAFRVWPKSPWTYLDPREFPPENTGAFPPVELHTGIGEYESAAFAVTNFAEMPLTLHVDTAANPGQIPVEFRYGYPVESVMRTTVNDPLPRLVDQSLVIPPHQSRELWLTLYTGGLQPGRYPLEIALTPADADATAETVKLELEVHPVHWQLPPDFIAPFFTLYTGPLAEDPEYVAAFRDNLESHSIFCQAPTLFPEPVFGPDGVNRTDYSGEVESMRRNSFVRDQDTVLIYWGLTPEAAREKLEHGLGAAFGTEEFNRRFKIWLEDWVKNLREQGLTNPLYMYVFDERTDAPAIAIFRLIKEQCPAVKTYATITSTATLDDIRAIGPWLDMISPHFQTFRDRPDVWSYLRSLHIPIAPYFNCVPCGDAKEPYSVYRKMGWNSYAVGASGFGTWLYFQPFFHKWTPPDMSMVYVKDARLANGVAGAPEVLDPADRVVTGKRLEGFREGVEDYGYLRMLEQYRDDPEAAAVLRETVASVLAQDSPEAASQAKIKLLNAIGKLQK